MSLLEQNIIRKGQVNKLDDKLLEPEREFEAGDKKKYKVEAIIDSAVYGQKTNGLMLGLYYPVLWKDYLGEKST